MLRHLQQTRGNDLLPRYAESRVPREVLHHREIRVTESTFPSELGVCFGDYTDVLFLTDHCRQAIEIHDADPAVPSLYDWAKTRIVSQVTELPYHELE